MTSSTAPAGPDLSRAEFIALLAAMMALNALAIDVMLPALPYMGTALKLATENERQFVISFYMLGLAMGQLAIGPISDRFGRRAPLFIGLAVYVVSAIAATFAADFTTLLVLRVAQGLGAAGTRVVAISVVRDRFSGRGMAEVMSLIFMVFLAIPIIAPGIGQILLLVGPWESVFLFMAALAASFGLWAYFRLPETLPVSARRPLNFGSVIDGFRTVFNNRIAIFYGLANMFLFGGLFGFVNVSQQVFVDIYGLGVYFPIAFAGIAGLMAVASFLNSRIVSRFGMRRISHFATLSVVAAGALLTVLSLIGLAPLWVFFILVSVAMFMFGWSSSNMNSLSMEPLGAVAGTASSVFGFIQTAGGAVLAIAVGQQFNGTVVPVALGFVIMGSLALVCVLIAEKGKLFGVSKEYAQPAPARS